MVPLNLKAGFEWNTHKLCRGRGSLHCLRSVMSDLDPWIGLWRTELPSSIQVQLQENEPCGALNAGLLDATCFCHVTRSLLQGRRHRRKGLKSTLMEHVKSVQMLTSSRGMALQKDR